MKKLFDGKKWRLLVKLYLPLLFLLTVPLAGCGSSAQASAFCQSVDTVKSDVNDLKSLKGNPSISAITAGLQKLQTDVNAAIAETKNTATPQVSALKSSMQQLRSTLKQVRARTLKVSDAVPTIRSQAQTVSQNWEALKEAMKC